MVNADSRSPASARSLRFLPLWTTLLLAACVATAPAPVDAVDEPLRAAIASPQRAPANRARDEARHPYETLRAFGVRPDWTVIEIAPGGGWYTEILAPYLRDRGHYVAALYGEAAATAVETERQLVQAKERFEAKFGRAPERYGRIVVGSLNGKGLSDVGGPASARCGAHVSQHPQLGQRRQRRP